MNKANDAVCLIPNICFYSSYGVWLPKELLFTFTVKFITVNRCEMNRTYILKCVVGVLAFVFCTLAFYGQESLIFSGKLPSDYYVEKLRINAEPKSIDIEQKMGNPYQFAIPYQVDFPICNLAVDSASKGYFHYLLQIDVPDAYAVNFTLKGLHKSGAYAVYLQNNLTGQRLGQYFPTTNKFDLTPFPIVYSSSVMVEIVSERVFHPSDVVVFRVGVTYDKNLLNSSEPCQVDIACPQGELYSDIKKSAIRLLIDNMWLCSGTVLNNTLEDRRPFILTANHCVDNEMSAANTAVFFNYESPYCEAQLGEYPSVNENWLAGATLRATKNDEQGVLDFTLLELSSEIPESYDVVFAGWSASTMPPDYSIGIHHPAGDVKKISIDYNAAVSSTFSSDYDANSHWRILKWDLGVTEGGSSGSAIFNRNKQVVGDLTGGEASCDYPYNDFYTKFSDAFDKYADSSQQLQYWLDPLMLNVYVWESHPKVEMYAESMAQVYPNPSDGYLFIYDLPLSKACIVSLFSIDGKKVWSSQIFPQYKQAKVDYPGELSGIYILKVKAMERTFEELIIIR